MLQSWGLRPRLYAVARFAGSEHGVSEHGASEHGASEHTPWSTPLGRQVTCFADRLRHLMILCRQIEKSDNAMFD
jgi:hypothetical protein